MGDFNARIVPTDLEEFQSHIGKAVFPSEPPNDDLFTTNYFKLLDFMTHNDFLIASSFHKRPPSRIITYREISSSPEASQTSPTNSDFACLDHVVAPMTALHNIKAVTTQPTWILPWFHRHYPLSFTVAFDKFLKPPRKPPPKITPPRTKTDQLEFQSKFAQAFAALTNTKFHSLQTSSLTYLYGWRLPKPVPSISRQPSRMGIRYAFLHRMDGLLGPGGAKSLHPCPWFQ